MARRIYPDIISNCSPIMLTPDRSCLDAARLMTARNVGALIIAEQGKLLGIVSERDLTRRIIAKDLDPATTHLGTIMTRDPATVAPDDKPADALALMRKIGCRHLPVVDGQRIIGMLSIRDLDRVIQAELEGDTSPNDSYVMKGAYTIGV